MVDWIADAEDAPQVDAAAALLDEKRLRKVGLDACACACGRLDVAWEKNVREDASEKAVTQVLRVNVEMYAMMAILSMFLMMWWS